LLDRAALAEAAGEGVVEVDMNRPSFWQAGAGFERGEASAHSGLLWTRESKVHLAQAVLLAYKCGGCAVLRAEAEALLLVGLNGRRDLRSHDAPDWQSGTS